MDQIRVNKSELLKIMKANLASHYDQFIKAQEGYRGLVVHKLDEALRDARTGREIRTHISLVAPEDHTKDYQCVIGMLELSLDDEINLGQREYAQYVDDEWGWKEEFVRTSTMYGKDH